MANIYALKCIVNGFVYIGCTAKESKRFREHRCLLRANKHAEKILQIDWNMYGESAFIMVHLEMTITDMVEEKRSRELYWMNHYYSEGLLYNRNMTSFSPTKEAIRMGIEESKYHPGNRWSPEANEKRRLSQLGIPKGHGAKISATKRAKRMMI